mgnify:CR=1 FL=1
MVWLINVLSWPIRKIREEIKFRKLLKELRDQDPFVYENNGSQRDLNDNNTE